MTGPATVGQTRLSWNLPGDLHQLVAYHFMVNAFEVGTVTAVVAGAIGWFMVLRRQSFAGHTLAVVAFPGAAGAIWLGLNAAVGYFGFAAGAALVFAALPRSPSGKGFSEESAVIGTVQAMALAAGFLFVSLYRGFLDSLTGLLFGSFLGVTDGQVLLVALVGLASLAALGLMARPLFFATVDEDVARARGVPVRLLSTVFLLVLGLAAAEVSQVTGSLLVFALLVMPAAAAQQVTARPGWSFTLTVLLSLVVTWLGLAAAYFSIYPVGFFVTTFGFATYLLAVGSRGLLARRGRQVRGPLVVAG